VRKLVVDASVAIKWLNPFEALADCANTVRDDYEQGQVSLLVPAFWDYEVANGINKAVARGRPSEEYPVFTADDPLWNLVGVGKGTGEPVARQHDDYLFRKD
jgi:predicted nucleic acid-binding protein